MSVFEDLGDFLGGVYGLEVRGVFLLEGGVVNDNYCVESDQGDFVWKLNSHKSRVEMEDELAMLQMCKDVPVSQVRSALSGDYIVLYDDKFGWLYPMIEGELMNEVNADLLRQLGEILGRIHVLCADVVPRFFGVTWDVDGVKELIDGGERKELFAGVVDLDFVSGELDRFDFFGLPKGMTHQDVKPENILMKDGVVSGVLDFDNCYYGVLLHDLTTTVIWTCFVDGQLDEDLLDALVEGYELVRVLSDDERRLLHESIAFRLIREVFVGPFAAVRVNDEVMDRAKYFLRLYKSFV